MLMRWLMRAGRILDLWAQQTPFTNSYGLARMMFALSTATTLLFSPTTGLFLDGRTLELHPQCLGIGKIGLFCLASNHLLLAKNLSVGVLLLVASGWRPRITGILHWWITFGFQASVISLDGGDQVASILTLLLIPVTLADPRKWHWDPPPPASSSVLERLGAILALFSLIAIRIQVAGIYFHSTIAKLAVPEWQDGTAVYYFAIDPIYGAAPWIRSIMMPLLINKFTVSALTWGTLVLELLLFMALTMPKRVWKYLLISGIFFHIAIAVIHGLLSFSLIMCGALILYLHPWAQSFSSLDKVWVRFHTQPNISSS